MLERLIGWTDARRIWITASLLALLAVTLGAFGSHVLADRMDNHAEQLYATAVTYQFYHVLALFMAGGFSALGMSKRLTSIAAWLFLAGILMFCGALYALSFGAPKTISILAPLGGGGLISGWLLLVLAAWQHRKQP